MSGSTAEGVLNGLQTLSGSMVSARVYDWLENDGQFYVGGWRWVSRCLDCGHVADGVMEPHAGPQSMPRATGERVSARSGQA
jgi:hypothetical protein